MNVGECETIDGIIHRKDKFKNTFFQINNLKEKKKRIRILEMLLYLHIFHYLHICNEIIIVLFLLHIP